MSDVIPNECNEHTEVLHELCKPKTFSFPFRFMWTFRQTFMFIHTYICMTLDKTNGYDYSYL